METQFTPVAALAGGALIGLSAVLLMALHGRIAGMTAIIAGILPPLPADWAWRAAFLAGAVAAPILWSAAGGALEFAAPTPLIWMAVGGVIVGVGVTFGSGCASGHGVCGIARLSPRSIVATLVFMAATAITVTLIRHGL